MLYVFIFCCCNLYSGVHVDSSFAHAVFQTAVLYLSKGVATYLATLSPDDFFTPIDTYTAPATATATATAIDTATATAAATTAAAAAGGVNAAATSTAIETVGTNSSVSSVSSSNVSRGGSGDALQGGSAVQYPQMHKSSQQVVSWAKQVQCRFHFKL